MSNRPTAEAECPKTPPSAAFIASAVDKRISISVPQTAQHKINVEHPRGICVTLQFATKKDRDHLVEAIVKWAARGMPPTQDKETMEQVLGDVVEVVGRKFVLYLPKTVAAHSEERHQQQLQIDFTFGTKQDVRRLISELRRWAQKDMPVGINRASADIQEAQANSRFHDPIIRRPPTNMEIRTWRIRVGLSQQQAFGLTYHGSIDAGKVFTAWQRYERGQRTMSPQDWLWFLLHTNQLEAYLLETYGETAK